ncbi:Piso0_004091 [Millerozyma farinosa CBS 7064]|uniref:Piso0_004091 protein n=1 Tax=Pichia sorbitophila (strain ATCC MYA-4447 / BCRC 22081 / CBS 7064 / NBRC 10061 / NRRL Y-12695) TaxID=559304 RepID=G8Y7G4_PICSO|nr:Piso0_004091 [Millerozyma farinosa CBS 7064]CCE84544.1 Piso0_004091 [Millerozyma farinosa CBS 7064]
METGATVTTGITSRTLYRRVQEGTARRGARRNMDFMGARKRDPFEQFPDAWYLGRSQNVAAYINNVVPTLHPSFFSLEIMKTLFIIQLQEAIQKETVVS